MAIAKISEVVAPATRDDCGIDGGHLRCIFEDSDIAVETDGEMCYTDRLDGRHYHGTSHMFAGGILTMRIVYLHVELGEVAIARPGAQGKRKQGEKRFLRWSIIELLVGGPIGCTHLFYVSATDNDVRALHDTTRHKCVRIRQGLKCCPVAIETRSSESPGSRQVKDRTRLPGWLVCVHKTQR